MLYVDSCIPMYLIGDSHPNKAKVIELIPQFLTQGEELITSVETFQEIIHRYKALSDFEHLGRAFDALEEMVDKTFEVVKSDVDAARLYAVQYKKLSSRDCLHAAVMKRIGCRKIWTFDKQFALLGGVQVVC